MQQIFKRNGLFLFKQCNKVNKSNYAINNNILRKFSNKLTPQEIDERKEAAKALKDETYVHPVDENDYLDIKEDPTENVSSFSRSNWTNPKLKEKYKVTIMKPSRIVTQNHWGEDRAWQLVFPVLDQNISPMIGWTGGEGITSPLKGKIMFETKEEAIEYAERQGYNYSVKEPTRRSKTKPKSYARNFNRNMAEYDD